MTITSKWFLCLYLNHGAFSYDFLPYPIEEGEIKSSWPRSALNTTEEQEIITKMQLGKKNLSLGWKFLYFGEPAQPLYINTTLQKISGWYFFPTFQASDPTPGMRRDTYEKLNDFSKKGRIDLQQRIFTETVIDDI